MCETMLYRDSDVRDKVRTLSHGNKELLKVWGQGAKIALQDERPSYGVQDGFEEGKSRNPKMLIME